ncbi:MAG: DUF6079 family protein [Myxococcota bacterium]
MKIGELIDVPEVRTVVRMDDLLQADARQSLAESFVLTDEVRHHLKRLLLGLSASTGGGTFLRGHYGAGKSHFLVFLQLLLQGEVNRTHLAELEPDLAPALHTLENQRFVVVSVSLVSHASSESLEAILSNALIQAGGPAPLPFQDPAALQAHLDTFRYYLRKHQGDTLEQFLLEHNLTEKQLFSVEHLDALDALAREVRYHFRPDPGRSARFQSLYDRLEGESWTGVVLLIDELSEFLHARSGAGLTEDVRFLQYLGEASRERPLHVIAALQEYLEAAEYGLPGELVRKIKDRYPNQLELTTTHIEELLSRRLIRHRPGADGQIEQVYKELRAYLQGFPVPSARFIRAYPVHPATLLLLDRLKALLSRSRGIVDFVHHRLKGNPARGIPGMLAADAHTLLTPDTIFDHFQVRIRENLETHAFEATVFEHYRRNIDTLFLEDEQRELALRLIKVLILLALSPEPRPYSVRTLTHALLVRVSRLDPDANFLIVQETLETLVSRGAWVERAPALPDGRLSFDDIYRISLRADLNLVAARRVQAAVASLHDAPDLRIFEALAPHLMVESMPLGRLMAARAQLHAIQWQRTQRDGRVVLGSLTSLDVPRLIEAVEELEQSELDWMVFLGLPYEVPAQRQQLEEVLLPALRRMDRPGGKALLFWLPEPLSFQGRDSEFWRETLARRAVLSREKEEAASSQSRGLIELLEKALESDRARVELLFHQAYYLGHLVSVQGPGESLANLGRPPFAQTLLAVLTPLLNVRFPDHAACAPLGRLPTLDDVESVVEKLYRVGSYIQKGEADPVATRLTSLLRPLKLLKKVGNQLTLAAEVDKPGPARALLEGLDQTPRLLKDVGLSLRKGSYGISSPMFQLLVLGLAYSGALVCFTGDRKREAGQLSALNFDQVQRIQRSEVAALELSPLTTVPFLPENIIPRGELTFARQEQLWSQLKEARDTLAGRLQQVQQGLMGLQQLAALKWLDISGLLEDIQRLLPLSQVGGTGTSPREGIEQFLAQVQALPQLPWMWDRLSQAARFLGAPQERYLFITSYLERLPTLRTELMASAVTLEISALEEKLRPPDLLVSPVPMELIEAAFQSLLRRWSDYYLDMHTRVRGPAQLERALALQQSQTWRWLQRLSRVQGLVLDDHLSGLERRLSQLQGQVCHRLKPEDLRMTPLCRCGFVPNMASPAPQEDELLVGLERALKGLEQSLQRPELRESLTRQASNLHATGQAEAAQALERVVEQLPAEHDSQFTTKTALELSKADVSALDQLERRSASLRQTLSGEALEHVEQALRGTLQIEERDLETLIQRLADRCLPQKELERVFFDWLAGSENPMSTSARAERARATSSSTRYVRVRRRTTDRNSDTEGSPI